MNKKDKINYVLGFPRRNSGAFEHAWSLAKKLNENGHNSRYYANWWDSPALDTNLQSEESKPLDEEDLRRINGVLYLQTHTWEYNGLLDLMMENNDSILIYSLHAIIPYFFMSPKNKIAFLNGDLPVSHITDIIDNQLSSKEHAQLSAIDKSDHILTISKNHKRVLELLGIKKPISIFENVSDVYDLPPEVLTKSIDNAKIVRTNINEENVILYCGNIYPKKGAFSLFESFKMIRERYPSSHLILLGSGENSKEKLFSYGLSEDELDSVSLVPWISKTNQNFREKVLKYFLASDVLIQPMITPELYSKAVIDAMTLGVPTITCQSPFTVGSSETSEAIYDSFTYFKENSKDVKEIVIKARKKIKRENTWDSYISRLEKIIS